MTIAGSSNRSAVAVRALALLVVVVSCGCRGNESPLPVPPSGAVRSSAQLDAAPLEMRAGWIEGECLATANKSLPPGSPITVVSLEDDRPIVEGRVSGPTTSIKTCPALREDRRGPNESEWSFYELELPVPVELGVGVVGETRTATGGLDLDEDGTPERFTYCASSEGMWFHVWSGPEYQGMPLWSGYYYLGFDTEVTCP